MTRRSRLPKLSLKLTFFDLPLRDMSTLQPSAALCWSLNLSHRAPRSAGMDIWQLSITTLTGVWVILPTPTHLLSLCQFPSWHNTNKVWLGLISPAADKQGSLARPTGNYCSIIIDGNQRWGLITPAVTWCTVCLRLFLYHHRSFFLSAFICVKAQVLLLCEALILADILYISK